MTPKPARSPTGLLSLGFRPFYAAAAIFAVLALGVWFRAFAGFSGTGNYLHGAAWHGHEMLFGFAAAVITGFLFTAVRNWTGLPTPTGVTLAGVAVLWIAGRILIISGPAVVAAVVDAAFLPVVGLAVALPIVRSKNTRNYKLLAILAALFLLNLIFHGAALGYLPGDLLRTAMLAGIDVIVILLALVAGRVVPAFTGNAVPDANPRNESWVEIASFATLILLVGATLMSPSWLPAKAMPLLCLVAAAAHATRLGLWDPARTVDNPLLWMMPAAYSWIPFALFLRALESLGILAGTAALHAMTIGAISSFMLAMMIRSSLGHTGRPLLASRMDMAAFVLLQIAAITRVTAVIVAGPNYRLWMAVATVLWVLAFLVFAIRFVPMLVSPRADAPRED